MSTKCNQMEIYTIVSFKNNIHIQYMSVYQIPKICQLEAAHFGNYRQSRTNNVCNKFSDIERPILRHPGNTSTDKSPVNEKQTTYKD